MKKIILSTGINGTYAGTVEVIFNYHEEKVPEERETTIFHKVVGEGHGALWESDLFTDPMEALPIAAAIEQNLKAFLDKLSKEEHPVTARDYLVRQGYM